MRMVSLVIHGTDAFVGFLGCCSSVVTGSLEIFRPQLISIIISMEVGFMSHHGQQEASGQIKLPHSQNPSEMPLPFSSAILSSFAFSHHV